MTPSREARVRAGREALDDLRRYRATVTLERFLAERDEQRQVQHALLIAVQSCVDEALAACRQRGLEAETYRGAFEVLGRAGVLPSAIVPDLMGWASLRNVITHFYPVVDLARIHASLDEIEVLARCLEILGSDAEADR